MQRINFTLNAPLIEQLKKTARESDMSMSELVRRSLEQSLPVVVARQQAQQNREVQS